MADTAVVIKAITDMHKSFGLSLKEVYTEIKGCNSRVTELEKALAIKKAVCKEKKEREKEKKENKEIKRDYWIPVVRSVSLVGIFALLALAWETIKKFAVNFWEILGQ